MKFTAQVIIPNQIQMEVEASNGSEAANKILAAIPNASHVIIGGLIVTKNVTQKPFGFHTACVNPIKPCQNV